MRKIHLIEIVGACYALRCHRKYCSGGAGDATARTARVSTGFFGDAVPGLRPKVMRTAKSAAQRFTGSALRSSFPDPIVSVISGFQWRDRPSFRCQIAELRRMRR